MPHLYPRFRPRLQIVDFGSVNVGGVVTHHLLVVNTLDTPIHVVLDLSPVPELKGSKHTSQVGRGERGFWGRVGSELC